jgi:hypothetical protein
VRVTYYGRQIIFIWCVAFQIIRFNPKPLFIMRLCYLFLFFALLSGVVTAQTTLIDFEGDAPVFTNINAISTIIPNPDMSEPNTSATVMQTVVPAGVAFGVPLINLAVDLSAGKRFTMQVWSPIANLPVLLKFEGNGQTERLATFTGAANSWQELSFSFAGDMDVIYPQIAIFMNFNVVTAANTTYYWDNLVQETSSGLSGPVVAAPTPTRAAADVISLFSDAYDDVPVGTFRADFSVAGPLVDTLIAGNATKLYQSLTFAGIEMLGDSAIDLTAAEMNFVHLDYWSPNASSFGLKLVDFGGDGFEGAGADTESQVDNSLAQGTWVSVDYPLSRFVMNQNDVSQMILVAVPGGSEVYLDNIYFYKSDEVVLSQVDLPVTFDNETIDYGLIDFEGAAGSVVIVDPTDPTNMVASFTKPAGAGTSAGTTLGSATGGPAGFASRIPLAEGASIISVRVWSPAAGVPVLLKVEQADNPAISVETLTSTTMAMTWETLQFDFSNERPATAAVNYASNYNELSIFFNFGTSPAADQTYFWDDVVFGTTTSVSSTPLTGVLRVFPNPVRHEVSITAPSLMTDLMVYDANGRVVIRQQPNTASFLLDMQGLKAGLYVALATTADGLMTVKLLKE